MLPRESIVDPKFPERCPQKMCVACGSLMPSIAKKCTVCSSFQDWRRYLPFDATILALLTALVSVLSTSFPNFVRWVEGKHSETNINWGHDDTTGGLFLLVANDGERPASIIEVSLMIPLRNAGKVVVKGRPYQCTSVDDQKEAGESSSDNDSKLQFGGAKNTKGSKPQFEDAKIMSVANVCPKREDEYFIPPLAPKYVHVDFLTRALPQRILPTDIEGRCEIQVEISEFRSKPHGNAQTIMIEQECSKLSAVMGNPASRSQ
jgi:hypothetical protein